MERKHIGRKENVQKNKNIFPKKKKEKLVDILKRKHLQHYRAFFSTLSK